MDLRLVAGGQRLLQPDKRIEDAGNFLRIRIAPGDRCRGAGNGRRRTGRASGRNQSQLLGGLAGILLDDLKAAAAATGGRKLDSIAHRGELGRNLVGRILVVRIVVDQVQHVSDRLGTGERDRQLRTVGAIDHEIRRAAADRGDAEPEIEIAQAGGGRQRADTELGGRGAAVFADGEIGAAEGGLDVDAGALRIDRRDHTGARAVDRVEHVLHRRIADETDIVGVAPRTDLQPGRIQGLPAAATGDRSGGWIDDSLARGQRIAGILRHERGLKDGAGGRIVVQGANDVVGVGITGRNLEGQGVVGRIVGDGFVAFADRGVVDERDGHAVGRGAGLRGGDLQVVVRAGRDDFRRGSCRRYR